MKKLLCVRLLPACAMLAFALVSQATAQQTLLPNGNFAAQPVGTAAQIGPNTGDSIDTTSYKGFRFFNVATNSGLSFGSKIIGHGSPGSGAIRLDADNPGAATIGQYGFDIETSHIPIVYGTVYRLSLDAAYIGGGNHLSVIMAEYDANGSFTGQQTVTVFELPSTDTTYHTYTYTLMPLSTAVTSVNIMFAPGSGEVGVAAVSLTNLRFGSVPLEKGKPAVSPKPALKTK